MIVIYLSNNLIITNKTGLLMDTCTILDARLIRCILTLIIYEYPYYSLTVPS